jgi:hypothetical protein
MVFDQDVQAMVGVTVHITDIPNSVGSTYSVGAATDTTGRVSFDVIPAANRGVEVTVPIGYLADASSSTRRIDVLFNASVSVSFTLIHH